MVEVEKVVVLGSSATALAVVQSVRRLGLPVVVADTQPGVAGQSRLVKFRLLTSKSEEATLDDLLRLREETPSALIADSDHWLRFLQQFGTRLDGEEGFTLLHPSASTLSLCLDKEQFGGWCAREGFPAPRQYHLEDLAHSPDLRFPLLLRPSQTCHDRTHVIPKAVEVHTAEELQHQLDVFQKGGVTPSISESLLRPGVRMLSVGLACRSTGETLSFVAERLRPTPELCAAGTFVQVCSQPDVQELGERVAARLGLYGVAEIEIIHDGERNESHVIEVNPRPWRQFALADRSQHPLLAFLLQRPAANGSTAGTAWMDFSSDLFACFSRRHGLVRNGRVSLWSYVRSLYAAREDIVGTSK